MIRLDSRDLATRSTGWDRLLANLERLGTESVERDCLGEDALRGTGRTSAQMKAAAAESLFVWCNGHLEYPKRLAEHLGRRDLAIISPDMLDDRFGQGRVFPGVVVDHAANLTDRMWAALSVVRIEVGDEPE